MAEEEKKTIFEGEEKSDEPIDQKKDQFLDEPDEHSETSEQVEQEMHEGKRAVNVYSKEGRDELMEDDEVAEWEQGFSEGATSDKAHCANCGNVLSQSQQLVEREIDDKKYFFCSDDCASKGIQHAKKP